MKASREIKIGILGSGQLGRMLAIAGTQLGLDISFLDEIENPPVGIFSNYVRGNLTDETTVKEFSSTKDIITSEFENIPATTLAWANDLSLVLPTPKAFEIASDRLLEKQLAAKLGIPIPKYIPVSSLAALEIAATKLPGAILKARSLGYDGKSQVRIDSDLSGAWKSVGERASILEEFFKFDFEVSLIAARSKSGETVFYDLAKNTHERGILIRTVVEPGTMIELTAKAQNYMNLLLGGMDYVGVLAAEFFVKGSELYFNEMAPRVHNTGHWTIEGAETSQFENHLRAICGFPLGSARSKGPCEMINIIGQNPDYNAVLEIKNSHLHMYGKEARPGRKLGHATVVGTIDGALQSVIKNVLN